MSNSDSLKNVLLEANCLYTLSEVEAALAAIIPAIERDLAHKDPIIIGVMNGGLVTLGYLLPRLSFLLEIDYVHATRYQNAEQPGQISWKRKPEQSLTGRHILLVDDILDQGVTLKAIADYCLAKGALSVAIAVLGEKHIANFSPAIAADYIALKIPDAYVFGYGMDYRGYWRNAPGIYVIKQYDEAD